MKSTYMYTFLVVALLGLFLGACNGTADSEPVVEPTVEEIAAATETAEPTPEPTVTVEPTATSEPTPTSEPTATSVPTLTPTDTPAPDPTATRPRTKATPEATDDPFADDLDEEDLLPVTGQLDPRRVMLEAETAVGDLNSVAIDQVISVALEGFAQRTEQSCVFDQAVEASYCHSLVTFDLGFGDPVTSTTEVVQRDRRLWLRQDDGPWEEASADMMAEMGIEPDDFDTTLVLSEHMVETELRGQRLVDGTEAYEIAFTLNLATYMSDILGPEMAALFLDESGAAESNGRIWIGVDDKLPRKIHILLDFEIEGEEIRISSQGAYHSFNEPVEIPDPR